MKLSKSTTILLNVVLVLLIVFLFKSLIAIPKSVYANPGYSYKLHDLAAGENPEIIINQYAKQGWRLHSVLQGPIVPGQHLPLCFIFER